MDAEVLQRQGQKRTLQWRYYFKTTEKMFDLIEQGDYEQALTLLTGDHHFSQDELNKCLMSACQHKHTLIVQMLVQQGSYVNYKDTNGNTPLLISVQRNDKEIVQFLLTNRANVNSCNSVGDSALILSLYSGSTEVTEILLKQKRLDIEHQNQDGYTAIMKAAEVQNVDALKLILDEYFDVKTVKERRTRFINKLRTQLINEHEMYGLINEHRTQLIKEHRIHELINAYQTHELIIDHKMYELINEHRIGELINAYRTHELISEHQTHELINEHKTHELISTLRETVNLRGENVHQIAERCGIGSIFQLLQDQGITTTSPLELALRNNDIKSFHIFLDSDFLHATERKKYLDVLFLKMFLAGSDFGVIVFKENEIAMMKALLEHGVDVNTTWLDHIPLFDTELVRVYHFEERPFGADPIQRSYCYKGLLDPIQIAAKSGCLKVLQLLLSHKADVNRYDFSSSPLHIALSHRHMECAEYLIKHGAVIDFNQILRLAVDQQEPKYVTFVIENYKNEVIKDLKRTSKIQDILLISVRKGNLEIIDQILELGADINGVLGIDVCPLVESKNGEVAKLLIDRGANVKHSKHEQQTISNTHLIKVFKRRESTDDCVIEVIKVMLENGASANDRSLNGKTALMLAAVKEGSMNVMQVLLDHGAELGERDREGKTALIHAVLTRCVKNVTFLLQSSKDRKELLNVQNDEGLTALMCAVKLRNSTIIKELIDQDADVNIKDTLGNSCLLHLLISKRHEDDILKYLINAGCDVNCQNNEGLSPLMMAAQNYSVNVMCVLLKAGAKINAVSNIDNTKTALAHLVYKHYDYFRCLEYLLDRGASCSYLAATTLHRMIVAGEIYIVPKLIRCGLGPTCILLNDMGLFNQNNYIETQILRSLANEAGKAFHSSPLCTALCVGKSALARFFVGNLFLTNSDVSVLGHNKWINDHLAGENYKECRNLLIEITTQPMTLFNLSFVAVSTAVGAIPGREIRVNKLPVPQIIKDKLLFKKLDVALTVPKNDITNVVHRRPRISLTL